MGWIDRIKSDIIIKTGDGKEYRPQYMLTSKETDYNTAEFIFPEVSGSLVKRGLPKGSRFSFKLFFQGDDHLDQMRAFEQSNLDRRPWEVLHPFYDDLLLQPLSLKYETKDYNVTEITGSMVETIKDEAPRITIDPLDKITQDVINVSEANAISFGDNVEPKASDVAGISNSTDAVFDVGSSAVKSGDQSNEYLDRFNAVKSALNTYTSNASLLATATNDLFLYPALFKERLKNRLSTLLSQFEKLSDTVDNLNDKSKKIIYQMQAGAIVTAAASASVNPEPGDYTDPESVLDITEVILDLYNDYIGNLDILQTDNGGVEGSFVPDYDAISSVSNLINFTISNLLGIATDSRQKRTLILEYDSNILLLSHRFYGLSVTEDKVDEFIDQNNIGLNEYLQVKKGRELVYFI